MTIITPPPVGWSGRASAAGVPSQRPTPPRATAQRAEVRLDLDRVDHRTGPSAVTGTGRRFLGIALVIVGAWLVLSTVARVVLAEPTMLGSFTGGFGAADGWAAVLLLLLGYWLALDGLSLLLVSGNPGGAARLARVVAVVAPLVAMLTYLSGAALLWRVLGADAYSLLAPAAVYLLATWLVLLAGRLRVRRALRSGTVIAASWKPVVPRAGPAGASGVAVGAASAARTADTARPGTSAPRRRLPRTVLVVGAAGLAGLGLLVGLVLPRGSTGRLDGASVPTPRKEGPGAGSVTDLVARVSPSVVTVVVGDDTGTPFAFGSGFLIGPGAVVTNHHVVAGAGTATVRYSDGTTEDVRGVLADDPEADLAILGLAARDTGRSALALAVRGPRPGDPVVVVGTPEGLEQTVSDGRVAALRELPDHGALLQITAPISHGSSGSPVFNMGGRVVGVAAMFLTDGQNLNFAIPADRLARLWGSGEFPLGPRSFPPGARPTPLATATPPTPPPAPPSKPAGRPSMPDGAAEYRLGLDALARQDYAIALDCFIKARDADPRNADCWFQIGRCLAEEHDLLNALVAYQRAIEIGPPRAVAHNNLGVVYGRLGRTPEAIAAYREALRVDPSYSLARENLVRVTFDLAESYFDAGDFGRAVNVWKGRSGSPSFSAVWASSLGSVSFAGGPS